MVQLSHPYTTTGKAIALTIQTFVAKVMSLLFTMLSRFAIALQLLMSKNSVILDSSFTLISQPVHQKSCQLCFQNFPASDSFVPPLLLPLWGSHQHLLQGLSGLLTPHTHTHTHTHPIYSQWGSQRGSFKVEALSFNSVSQKLSDVSLL